MENLSKTQRSRGVDVVAIVALLLWLAGLTVTVSSILRGQYQASHADVSEKWAGLSVVLTPLLASVIFAPLFLAGAIVAGLALRRHGHSRVIAGVAFGLGLPSALISLYFLAFALYFLGGSLFS